MTDAVFVIDKPAGPTSFDMVRQVKRVFKGAKVGHAGSLDPFATGVLVILVGKATKHSNLLLNADKRYIAKMKLGEATDSMDVTGTVIERRDVPALTAEDAEKCLKSFEGEWMQTPPMYSAKKIRGVRLYELARQNIEVRREATPVQLHEMKLVAFELPWITFEVVCSKGTYIRSLADAIGRRLGTVAHLEELRRTGCGEFTVTESVTVTQLASEGAVGELETGRRNYTKLLRGGRQLFPNLSPAGVTSSIANGISG